MASSTGLMHTRIYVLADDAAAARDEAGRRVFSREEIKERTVTDKYTDVRQILVCPSATEQCKALRDFFNRHKPDRSGGMSLVIQTRHDWSPAHIEDEVEGLAVLIGHRFKDLTGLSTAAGGYYRLHRWRYASANCQGQ